MTIFKRNKRISNNEQPKALFWSLLVMILLCVFSYGYFVRSTIISIVTRQGMEKDILALSSKVITLEADYVKVKNNVTTETAQSMGFVAASVPKFIDRTDTKTPGLSLNLR